MKKHKPSLAGYAMLLLFAEKKANDPNLSYAEFKEWVLAEFKSLAATKGQK